MLKYLLFAFGLIVSGGHADAAETKPPPPIALDDIYVAQAVVIVGPPRR